MLLGMDILQKMDMRIYLNGKLLSPSSTTHPSNTCAVSPAIGLQDLTSNQKRKLNEIIDREKKRFESVTGVASITQHEIRLKNKIPIKQR